LVVVVMTVCKRVRYSGQVQGVGFRATAQSLAGHYPVGGYVRNLPTGDVELVAEGEAGQVQAFLAAVARRMGGYIQHTTVQEMTPTGLTRFNIRY
jgi:acylphosphatase